MGSGSELGSKVYINIYNFNAALEVFNWLVLRPSEIPIFHTGVQIHDWEFTFAKSRSSSSGVVLVCKPEQFTPFRFCESIFIGWTDLSKEEFNQIVTVLANLWCAHPYHIIRHNCLHFSEALVERLGLGDKFP